MIAIQVGTEFLDLQDVKIRVRMESPLFTTDVIAPAFTFPVQLPRTPVNTRLLNHSDRISRTEKNPTTPCIIWVGGMPWRSAVITFRRFRNGRFDVDMGISRNIDIERFTNRRLRSFDMGTQSVVVPFEGDVDVQLDALNTLLSSHTGVLGATATVYAPFWDDDQIGGRINFFGAFETDPLTDVNRPGGLVNKYRGTSEPTRPWLYYEEANPIIYWVHLMCPMLYLAYVVQQVFKQLGYSFTSDVMDEDEVRRMVIFSNVMHTFYIGTNTGGPGASVAFLTDQDPDTFDLATALPDMSLIEFMIALQKRFNGRFLNDSNTRMRFVSLRSVLRSSNKRDISSLIDPEPDFEVGDDEGYEFTPATDKLEGTEQDAADPDTIGDFDFFVYGRADLDAISATNGQTALVKSTNEVYYYHDTVWERKTDFRPTVTSGDAKAIDIGVALTRMAHYTRPEEEADSMIVPRIEMPLSTTRVDAHNVGRNDVQTLRLLFYRGLQDYASGADQYPLLTTGMHDAAGILIDGATQTERIEGPGGIKATWYDEWLEFMANPRTAKKRVRSGPDILHNFQWDEKLHDRGTDYLVKSIDVELTATSMGVPTLELVRIPPGQVADIWNTSDSD